MQCKRFNYKKKMRKYQMAKKEGLCMEELQINEKEFITGISVLLYRAGAGRCIDVYWRMGLWEDIFD